MLKLWQVQTTVDHGAPGTVLRADSGEWVVACGTGAVRLEVVQPEGSRKMPARDYLAGHPLAPGVKLGL
jgi:methionyl-tRNA formyltransferase